MLRVRVEGAAQEAAAFADALARAGVVLGRSRAYEGRGARRDVRIYLEVDASPAVVVGGASLFGKGDGINGK